MAEAATQDELFYRRALRRIYIHALWIAAAGGIVAGWREGAAWAVGFLAGAAVSIANFRWLHRLVDSVGAGPKKPGKLVRLMLIMRYPLFGLMGYVIVKYFRVNLMAALIGLFVAVAAVVVEILYELIYART